MFDEGENLVTIHLPEYVRKQKALEETPDPVVSEYLKAVPDDFVQIDNDRLGTEFRPRVLTTDNSEDDEAFKPVIRDFSMDKWNGQSGITYWGYNDAEGHRKQ